MKNKELFDKTVSILVKAYMRGDLNADSCAACAVGNILGHGNWKGGRRNEFQTVFPANSIHIFNDWNESGYNLWELARIEEAFLKGVDYQPPNLHEAIIGKNNATDEGNFKGLMSVLDTLQKIHECSDKEKEEAKALFVKC